jgi:hypothetical protein
MKNKARSFWGYVEGTKDSKTVRKIEDLAREHWQLSTSNEASVEFNSGMNMPTWVKSLTGDLTQACKDKGLDVNVMPSNGHSAYDLYRGVVEKGSARARIQVPILAERTAVLEKPSEPPRNGEELWPYWKNGNLIRNLPSI